MAVKFTDTQVNLNAMKDHETIMYDPSEKVDATPLTYEERLESIETAVEVILMAIGEDPNREGLLDTPRRVAKMWLGELAEGYSQPLEDVIGTAVFDEGKFDEMIIVKDIPMASCCEHHMIPYTGKAHFGYVPHDGQIVGISKISRLVQMAGRRLTIQERLATDIVDAFEKRLHPDGVICVLEGEHLCMNMRGVRTPGAMTTVSVVRGIFKYNEAARNEFLSLIRA